MYGLLKRDLDNIYIALRTFEEIEMGIIFGSRALGNYKNGSDVDLAIVGERVNKQTVLRLYDLLNEELPLPYFFDVIALNDIKNEKLIDHIEKFGAKIYIKQQ